MRVSSRLPRSEWRGRAQLCTVEKRIQAIWQVAVMVDVGIKERRCYAWGGIHDT